MNEYGSSVCICMGEVDCFRVLTLHSLFFHQCYYTMETTTPALMIEEDGDSLIRVYYCDRNHSHVVFPDMSGRVISPILTGGGSLHLAINLSALDQTRDDFGRNQGQESPCGPHGTRRLLKMCLDEISGCGS
jgi:hypothetical protein